MAAGSKLAPIAPNALKPDGAAEKMPAAGGSIAEAKYRVNMEGRSLILAKGNVAEEAQNLTLLIDRDRTILLPL